MRRSTRGLNTTDMYQCDAPSGSDTSVSTPFESYENDIFGCLTIAAASRNSLSAV